MTKSFKERLNAIKQTHNYRVERTKIEFVRGLSRLMRVKGISNSELAQKVDTSNAYITKALRGDCNFTIDSMVKLAHAVGANIHIHVADTAASVRWLEKHTCNDRDIATCEHEEPPVSDWGHGNLIDLENVREVVKNAGRRLYA